MTFGTWHSDQPADGPRSRADQELLRMPVRVEHDIFVMRQRGREVAAGLGLEQQDQVRVATALSEVGRQMLAHAGGAVVVFRYRRSPERALYVQAQAAPGSAVDRAALREAVAVAAPLVDGLSVSQPPDPAQVSLHRRLPPAAPPLQPGQIAELRDVLARSAPATEFEELTVQNRQLLATLEEVQRQRDELLRLNAELEETNRGVMAVYHQLSQELEETNRGVVALYAELDQRSAQLREASEAKSRFLASVSHELRAPVASVIGLSRLLTDTGSDPLTPEQAEQVELISSSATELLTMVNGLLDLAKAESGRLEPAWERVRLAEVFGQVRATLRGLAERPRVELIVADVSGLPPLRTDPLLLTQVLRNLVTNGLKFTPAGQVRLGARIGAGSPERVLVNVTDTGIGIEPAHQERIFEEFYQVPGASAVDGARGTGLGLPYARRLARLLGGDLRMTSEPGLGSTFILDLPLDGVEARGAPPLDGDLPVDGVEARAGDPRLSGGTGSDRRARDER